MIHLGTELGLSRATRVGVGGKPKFPFRPFCLGSHWNEEHRLAWWAEAGVQECRIDISWVHVEATQGTFVWSGVDTWLAGAEARGIKTLAILGYSPTWATSWLSGDPGSSNQYIHREEHEGSFANFINQVALRYGRRMTYEIWNEPDHGNFLRVGTDSWAANHHGGESATVQRRLAYERMKAIAYAQPAMQGLDLVCSGMAMGGGAWDSGFLEHIAGLPAHFDRYDAVNYHVYGYPDYTLLTNHPETWRDTLTDVQRGQLEHWITEHGITSIVDDALAQRYLVRSYAYALAQPNITKVYWFRGGYAANIMGFLTQGPPSERTPVYYTFQVMTQLCANPLSFAPWELGTRRGAMVVRGDGSRLLIAWDDSSTGTIASIGLSPSAVYDMDGDSVETSDTLGADPVFLIL